MTLSLCDKVTNAQRTKSWKARLGTSPSRTIQLGGKPAEIYATRLNDRLTHFKDIGESITYWDGRTRLSVAGVQDKLNLLEIDGKLGFGEGELCSNKIFKFETGKAPFIAVNELKNVDHVTLQYNGQAVI